MPSPEALQVVFQRFQNKLANNPKNAALIYFGVLALLVAMAAWQKSKKLDAKAQRTGNALAVASVVWGVPAIIGLLIIVGAATSGPGF